MKLLALCTAAGVGIACTALSGCGGQTGQSTAEAQPEQIELSASRQLDNLDTMIKEVETSGILTVQADGTVALDDSDKGRSTISPQGLEFAQVAVQNLNKEVRAGNVKVKPDLTVTSTESGESRLPRYVGRRWWGVTFYFSHADIERSIALWLTVSSIRPTPFMIVSGAAYGSLNYVCSRNSHQGAYLYVTWIGLWAAGPNP